MKLKPCPFCGGEAKVSLFLGNYGVACTECLGAILPARKMTKTEAIEEWNTRKPMEKIINHLAVERAKALYLCDNNSRYKGYDKAIEIVKGGAE